MNIFIVSLPRFSARYQHITKHISQVSRLPWEIVGIDGSELAGKPEFETMGHSPDLSPGQIGCALAHCRAYERMQELGLSMALVVEDDMHLPNDLDVIAARISSEIRQGEVIQLHNPMMEKNPFSRHWAVEVLGSQLIYPMSPRSIRSASAYIITVEAAEAIRRINQPVRYVADHWDAFYDEGCVSSYRILHPSPCRWLPFESSIGYVKSGTRADMLRTLMRHFPLGESIKRLRRRLIFFRRLNNVVMTDDISPLARD